LSTLSLSDKIFGQNGGRLDVLKRNAFGRSALTEGFASGDTKTIERLLNHDSAEEERLIGGLHGNEVKTTDEDDDIHVKNNVDDGGGNAKKKKNVSDNIGIVHEFDFLTDVSSSSSSSSEHHDEDKIVQNNKQKQQQRVSVLVRELPIAHANDPFGQSPIEDTTGLGIWCASLVLSRWMASPAMVARMSNKTVLELGAGCGTPSLCVAMYGTPKCVTITDLNPITIHNAQYNIELNRLNNDKSCGNCLVTATSIDWGDETTYPTTTTLSQGGKFDYVICSDCIYQRDIGDLLKKVVTGLLTPENGAFLYVAPESGRDGLDEFIESMKSDSTFECIKEVIAPDSYRTNPLTSGDEEDCFLHFHELASKVYILYEFRRC
jgi:predicted nicotinamide N-methyase